LLTTGPAGGGDDDDVAPVGRIGPALHEPLSVSPPWWPYSATPKDPSTAWPALRSGTATSSHDAPLSQKPEIRTISMLRSYSRIMWRQGVAHRSRSVRVGASRRRPAR
jgi:hypothetical protein